MPLKEDLLEILRLLDDARYEYSKDELYSKKGQDFLERASLDLRNLIIKYDERKEEEKCVM